MRLRWAVGDLSNGRRNSIFANLMCATALVLIVGVLYVLSYAPVVRICQREVVLGILVTEEPEGRIHRVRIADSSRYPAYRTIDWVIDNTPLREPIFLWASAWGVREEFEFGKSFRERER